MKILDGKKTYIGILVAATPTIAGLFGYNISVEGAGELGGILENVMVNIETVIETVGLMIAAYGRIVTKSTD